MWFKKKSVLQGEGNYNSNIAVDGTDWRTTGNGNGWFVSYTLPSAADANNYFYLPALGYYDSGQLISVGTRGLYWSSSATPWSSNRAFFMVFDNGSVHVTDGLSLYGYRVGGFE